MRPAALVATSILAVAAVLARAGDTTYEPDWASLDARPVPAWFDEAKFGIFIHWGVYSVPAWGPKGSYAEWYWDALQNRGGQTWAFHVRNYGERFQYQDFAAQFKAELFDPVQWADLFARSGARYVVLTSKHHEGFCLWPSAQSRNWNSVDLGPHRDLCGDLAKAVRARGLKMGFYYSLYEWFHPLYRSDFPRFVRDHFQPQFKDLVMRYKPSLIFADGEWDHTSAEWETPGLLAWLFNQSPCRQEVVINDRWGKETRSRHGGYFTTEYGEVGGGKQLTAGRKWEENRAMGASFGFNRNEALDDYRTSHSLICLLVDAVSKGGNLCLDVGPTADGRIPLLMQQRLADMGDWLRINGEAIYGTRPWKTHGEGPTPSLTDPAAGRNQVLKPGEVRFTSKGDALYAICPELPKHPLRIKSLAREKIASVALLGGSGKADWSQTGDGLLIQPAANWPCDHAAAFKVLLAK